MEIKACVAKNLCLNAGIKLADGDVAFRPMGIHYVMMKLSRVLGMFDATQSDTIFVFDDLGNSPELTDYVLLHELGHMMSYRCDTAYHAFVKAHSAPGDVTLTLPCLLDRIKFEELKVEEEAIADSFAAGMLVALGLPSNRLLQERLGMYHARYGFEKMAELNRLAMTFVPKLTEMIDVHNKEIAA